MYKKNNEATRVEVIRLSRLFVNLALAILSIPFHETMGDDAPIFWERKAKVAKFLTH